MGIAALCAWSVTAAAGLFLLGTWVMEGGVRRVAHSSGRHRRLPPTLVFGHFLLAACGLLVWIAHLVLAWPVLGWVALIILLPVVTLGLSMFIRWVPTYRLRRGYGNLGAAHRAPPERHFPLTVVLGHGLLAAGTVALVVLANLGVQFP